MHVVVPEKFSLNTKYATHTQECMLIVAFNMCFLIYVYNPRPSTAKASKVNVETGLNSREQTPRSRSQPKARELPPSPAGMAGDSYESGPVTPKRKKVLPPIR